MRANGGGGDLRGGSSPDLLPMAAYKPHPPQMHGMFTLNLDPTLIRSLHSTFTTVLLLTCEVVFVRFLQGTQNLRTANTALKMCPRRICSNKPKMPRR